MFTEVTLAQPALVGTHSPPLNVHKPRRAHSAERLRTWTRRKTCPLKSDGVRIVPAFYKVRTSDNPAALNTPTIREHTATRHSAIFRIVAAGLCCDAPIEVTTA